jgi:Skp family chaperone for outer membrane proteins
MFGIFDQVKHKLRMELEELKHKSRLEIAEIRTEVDREKKQWAKDKNLELERMEKEHEIKLREVVSLTKLDSEQRIKKAELEFQEKFNQKCEELNKTHYDKLSQAMTKLHEEGNNTTKFTQDLALKMMEGMPTHKLQTKVITSGE